jgi:hypothetical protein
VQHFPQFILEDKKSFEVREMSGMGKAQQLEEEVTKVSVSVFITKIRCPNNLSRWNICKV